MQVRTATERDIDQILLVLKESLGETSSKKTEEVWRYKHLDNPFGKSLVLVAEENGEILGVRAFMRWKWQKGSKVYSAFRAVDTATHPKHQGKGIFKKLTLKALEIGIEEGSHFVFNTPNSQSKPGYLKMGWKEVNKLKIRFRLISPFLGNDKKIENYKIKHSENQDLTFLNNYNLQQSKSQLLFTPKNRSYLDWRYLNNPLQKYQISSNQAFFIAGYIKIHKNFRELRISEILFENDEFIPEIKKQLKIWAKRYGANFISYGLSCNLKFNLGFSVNIGPVLTFKDLNLNPNENNEFLNLNSWSYNLGDLELF